MYDREYERNHQGLIYTLKEYAKKTNSVIQECKQCKFLFVFKEKRKLCNLCLADRLKILQGVEYTCHHCGKHFFKSYKYKAPKFCSKSCRDKANPNLIINKHKKGENDNGNSNHSK